MPAESALRMTTMVGPGHRIEIVAPDLAEGSQVEVLVTPRPPEEKLQGESLLEFLASLPPGPRSAATWEEVEANLRADRDSWDR